MRSDDSSESLQRKFMNSSTPRPQSPAHIDKGGVDFYRLNSEGPCPSLIRELTNLPLYVRVLHKNEA